MLHWRLNLWLKILEHGGSERRLPPPLTNQCDNKLICHAVILKHQLWNSKCCFFHLKPSFHLVPLEELRCLQGPSDLWQSAQVGLLCLKRNNSRRRFIKYQQGCCRSVYSGSAAINDIVYVFALCCVAGVTSKTAVKFKLITCLCRFSVNQVV